MTYKQYVEFLFPNRPFSESEVREVGFAYPSRYDVVPDVPSACFGYRFFERKEIELLDCTTRVVGPTNYSGITYFGHELTLDDVETEILDTIFSREREREMCKYRLLRDYMQRPGHSRVIRSRHGTIHCLGSQDALVEN